MLASVKSLGTTEYVLMNLTVLKLLTISSNTGLSSESEEYILGIGATRFVLHNGSWWHGGV